MRVVAQLWERNKSSAWSKDHYSSLRTIQVHFQAVDQGCISTNSWLVVKVVSLLSIITECTPVWKGWTPLKIGPNQSQPPRHPQYSLALRSLSVIRGGTRISAGLKTAAHCFYRFANKKTEQSDLAFHLMFYYLFMTPQYKKNKKEHGVESVWSTAASANRRHFHLQQHPHDVIVVTSPFHCNTNCFQSACPVLPCYFHLFLWYFTNFIIILPRRPWETLCGSLLWLFLQLLKEFME